MFEYNLTNAEKNQSLEIHFGVLEQEFEQPRRRVLGRRDREYFSVVLRRNMNRRINQMRGVWCPFCGKEQAGWHGGMSTAPVCSIRETCETLKTV